MGPVPILRGVMTWYPTAPWFIFYLVVEKYRVGRHIHTSNLYSTVLKILQFYRDLRQRHCWLAGKHVKLFLPRLFFPSPRKLPVAKLHHGDYHERREYR